MKTTSGDGEKNIESYLIKACNEHNIWYAKLVKQRGIPDRIFVNKGLTIFAELKTRGKKPRESQIEKIKEMRRHGAIVFVIDTLNDAKKLIKMLIAGRLDDDFQMKQESSDDIYDGYNYDY